MINECEICKAWREDSPSAPVRPIHWPLCSVSDPYATLSLRTKREIGTQMTTITAIGIRTPQGIVEFIDECVICGEVREIVHNGFCDLCV